MTRTKTNLKLSTSNAPIYPNKFDARQYVEKRVANDLCIQTYGRELGWNKEIEAICDLLEKPHAFDPRGHAVLTL